MTKQEWINRHFAWITAKSWITAIAFVAGIIVGFIIVAVAGVNL